MILFLYLFIFLFGSIVGSFLNVVICRLETDEGIVKKRSHCVKCGQVLAWHDLIPIISFLWLHGRCRSCGKPISWQYPLVEIITGVLFVLTFYLNYELRITNYGYELFAFSIIHNSLFIIQLLSHWFIVSCLVVIFVYDLRHYIIPDVVLFPAIAVSLAYRFFEILNFGNWDLFGIWKLGFGIWQPFWLYLLSALVASAFFLLLILITRGRGMGIGDAKLAVLMGLLLGWPNILFALFLAFFSGALFGVSLIILGRKTMKSQIPFGPFLIGGTIILLLFGQFFWEWPERIFF